MKTGEILFEDHHDTEAEHTVVLREDGVIVATVPVKTKQEAIKRISDWSAGNYGLIVS